MHEVFCGMAIYHNIIHLFSHLYCSLEFGLGDILKPDLIFPLLETLPLEERLASYLPEVSMFFEFY